MLQGKQNIGLQTVCNIINIISKRNDTEDTSNTGLKRYNEEKELKKKDEFVRSEDIQGYQGDKSIEEIIIGDEKFIGDKSSDSKKNKDSKTKIKSKSRNENSSGDNCLRPKNGKMIIAKYNSVEEVSTKVFQPMDNDDESNSIKSSKKSTKKVPKQNHTSKKFATTEQTLDVLSLKSQNTNSTDFVLITNKKSRKKPKSENTLNATTSNFPPQDTYLLSQYTQPKSVKNKKKKKFTSSMTHSNNAEDSVQTLPGSSALSKQPSYIEAPKTNLNKAACAPAVAVPKQRASPASILTTKENNKKVKLLVKQSHSKKAKDTVKSLLESSALSKQPSCIEAPKTNLDKAACAPAVAVPKQRASPASILTTKENNKKVKLLVKQSHSKKAKDTVKSLLESSALSKQPSCIEAPKTNLDKAACAPAVAVPKQRASPASILTTKENNKKVKLLVKQSHSNKAEDSVSSLPASSALSKYPSYKEALKINLNKAACAPAVAVPKQRASPASILTTKENNKEMKLLVKQSHSNKAEDSVKSLLDSSALSKQPSCIEATKTNLNKAACVPAAAVPKQIASPVSILTPVEYNHKEVILFVKQAWQDVEKEKINGRLNILEYKRE